MRRVTHEGMCLVTCKTLRQGNRRGGVTRKFEFPERLSAWDRQQHSARRDTVRLFDGAGDGGKTRVPGRGWQRAMVQEHETTSPSI